MHSLISLARSNSEEFAWVYMKKPGYTAVTRGEVIYLIQCRAIKVKVIATDMCYQELVVKDNLNNTRYVKPSTRIIVNIGTEIECCSMIPPMYNIDGTWIRVGSEITIPIPPERLTAQPSLSWAYGNMVTLNRLGILSDQQMIQYRSAIISPLEQNSILTSFSRKVGNSIEYHGKLDDFSSALNTNKLTEEISKNLLYQIYGWWEFIIRNLSGIVGFVILWNMFISLCSCIVNLVLLYKRFGFSSILLFSIWSAMTKHILYGDVLQRSKKDVNPNAPSQPVNNVNLVEERELSEIATSLYPQLVTEQNTQEEHLIKEDGGRPMIIR